MATEQKPKKKEKGNATERSFIMVKPDGVQRGLIGEIIKRFEQKGFKLVAMKFLQVTGQGRRSQWCILCMAIVL